MSLIVVWVVLLVEFAMVFTAALALVSRVRRNARGSSAHRARPAAGTRAACR